MWLKKLNAFLAVSISLLVSVGAVSAKDVLPTNIPVYNVVDFGAVGDGVTENADALQSAVDHCSSKGGGTVYVPNGTFVTGTVVLKTNVFLYLEAGAVLKGSGNLGEYLDESEGRVGIINAEFAQNLGILGQGTIDGNGFAFWEEDWTPKERPMLSLYFDNCNDVTIRDITILNSPALTIYLKGVNGAVVEGVTIISPLESPNTDAIDPSGSRNIRISNCYLSAGDDIICFKSPKGYPPTEDITVTNCILVSDDSAIKLGTSSNVVTRRVTVSNCVIRDTRYGISLFMKDGGTYENITFDNIVMHTGGQSSHYFPIFIDIETRDGAPLGTVRDITFSNMQIVSGGHCLIGGAPGKPLENITFDNITWRMETAQPVEGLHKPRGAKELGGTPTPADFTNVPANISFYHIKGLTVRNFKVIVDDTSGEDRHFLFGHDIVEGVFDGLEGGSIQGVGGLSAILMEQSSNLVFRNCLAKQGAGVYLELAGERTDDITLIGNVLHNSTKPFVVKDGASKRAVTTLSNRLK